LSIRLTVANFRVFAALPCVRMGMSGRGGGEGKEAYHLVESFVRRWFWFLCLSRACCVQVESDRANLTTDD
jgi:hypothetical protein